MANTAITPMNQQPIIIDGCGIYKMRNGIRAHIHEVQPHGNKEVTRFNCKGSTEKIVRGTPRFQGYRIWHESGMATAFESEWDILEKISSEAA